MKKISAHSKTSLFLMEMIFVLLFLALSSAACIRIFAAAKNNHIQAQEWRHIQTLTTSVGEILEDSDETANSRQGTLTFYHATNDIQIYTIDLVFPIIENSDKEASS